MKSLARLFSRSFAALWLDEALLLLDVDEELPMVGVLGRDHHR